MATTEVEDLEPNERPEGIIAQVGATTYRVVAETSDTIYGAVGRPLWPVALIILTGVALALGGAFWLVVGVVSLTLLAVYVGAKR